MPTTVTPSTLLLRQLDEFVTLLPAVTQLRELAGTVVEATDRAGGAMFPKRLHGARVSIKKLRYAMEIATATGAAKLEDAAARRRLPAASIGRERCGARRSSRQCHSRCWHCR